ncbi:MAG: EamA family transporter [Lachnospiraceae bacterium]|nr:EamA family transporter [Candidatus Equihabitans merdae]
MNNKKGYFAVLAGAMWGCIGFFVRYFTDLGMGSMDLTFMRATLTAIMLFIYTLFFDRKMFRIRLKDLWIFVGNGVCALGFFFFCYNKAIAMTSLSTAAVLLYTAPAFVMVMSYFLFKESFSKAKVTALVMTLVGCLFVSGVIGTNANLTFAGILVGLGAGLGYALYSIFSRFAFNRGYTSTTLMLYTYLACAVVTAPFAKMPTVMGVTFHSGKTFGMAIAYVLISTVIPYIFYNIALKNADNGRCSIMASVEPVVATICGFLLFGETPTLTGILGMALVIGAIVLCNVKNKA